jgi:D-alanyl-D-alanine carboxypeptidase
MDQPTLHAHIEAAMRAQHIPGLALAILRGDEPLYTGYHGLANVEHGIPVTAATVWQIASITKPFTAQAILLLADEGRLDLDAPIAAYLSDLPAAWQPVTIRHCLAHQSGIPSYTTPDAYWAQTRQDKSHAEILALVRDLPLNFPPGTRYSYDNTGFYLLGMVLEAITGQAYGDVIRDRILNPLGMTTARANDASAIIPNRAEGYTIVDGQIANAPPYSTSNTFSAGVLVAALPDLIRWRAALRPDGLLPADTLRTMLTPHPSAEGNERDNDFTMGLGWFLVDHPYGQFIGHNGSIAGFAAAFVHLIAHDLTLISLCNQGDVPEPHALALETAVLLLPELEQIES